MGEISDSRQAADGEPGLVSVIIIFLDEERFLEAAVDSVIAQDYASWELLLVDDGSTDASPQIAQRLAGKDSRIRYLTHPGRENRGMSASRNLGLSEARGEYVAFLDADDVYMPQRLRRHVEVLNAYPEVAMSASSYVRWFTDSKGAAVSPAIASSRPFFSAGDQIWQPPLGLIIVTWVPYLGLGTCSMTVRRRIAIEVGGFENEFRSLYEDRVFASKVLARYRVYVIQAHLARYRHHEDSFTRKAKTADERRRNVGERDDAARFSDWLQGYLSDHGVKHPLLDQALRGRLMREQKQPGTLAGSLRRAVSTMKSMVARALPSGWYRRLLVIDFQIDHMRARRDYRKLTRVLSERSLAEALSRNET